MDTRISLDNPALRGIKESIPTVLQLKGCVPPYKIRLGTFSIHWAIESCNFDEFRIEQMFFFGVASRMLCLPKPFSFV